MKHISKSIKRNMEELKIKSVQYDSDNMIHMSGIICINCRVGIIGDYNFLDFPVTCECPECHSIFPARMEMTQFLKEI